MSFDLNFIFGISGILLSVTSVALAIYFYKVKRYPGSITYIEDQSIGLINSLIKNFSQVNITYENKNITQQIALVKGYLINDGSIDISPNMIEKNLTLSLPNDFKWLSAKIVDRSEGNKATLEVIGDKKIEFNLELFRRNEYISFEALAEVTINDKDFDSGNVLSKSLLFNHRIADTDEVRKQNLDLKKVKFWNFYAWFLLSVSISILAAVFWSLTFRVKDIAYSINIPEKHMSIKVYPFIENDSLINLLDENGKLYKKINIEQLNRDYIKQLQVGQRPHHIGTLRAILLLFLIMGALFFDYRVFSNYIEYKKAAKIKKIVNLLNKSR